MLAASPTWTAVDSRNVIPTGLRGTVSKADIQRWAQALAHAVASIPDGTTFALVADLTSYQPDRLATHRTIREVVPRLLTRHGMRDVHFDPFPGGPEPRLRQERGVSCDTYANVHPHAEPLETVSQQS